MASMWRYIVAAFKLRFPIAGLGAVPVNMLVVVAVAILGFAAPPLWLLGLGVEVAYLFGLATNQRFQRLVNANDSATVDERGEQWEHNVVQRLPANSQFRVAALDDKIARTLSLYADTKADEFVVSTNRGALAKLRSSCVELLRAQQTLRSLEDARRAEARIRGEVSTLEREIAEPGLTPPVRDAKSATLETLHQQLTHLERREISLREIDTYLAQIEAQVDLTLEAAASKGRQEAISAEIDVASFSLDALRSDVLPEARDYESTRPPGRVTEGH